MKRFVRQIATLAAFLLLNLSASAADIPAIPQNHIYDPDFLITGAATRQIGNALAKFKASDGMEIYVAVYTATPELITETAQQLNQAWNQSGGGVVIVFAPRQREVRVEPSPELSLLVTPEKLSATFQRAAAPALSRGDYSGAAMDGTQAIMKHLAAVRALATETPATPFQFTRSWLLALLGCGALAACMVLWFAARHWRRANLFDHRYYFAAPAMPVALRFGAQRCGGRMATICFRAGSETKDA